MVLIKDSDKSGRKEGNVLFNDTLNTFYLWLYGIGHMVKDHSAKERKPASAITWATQKDLLYALSHRITYTITFVTPVMEKEISQSVQHKGLI